MLEVSRSRRIMSLTSPSLESGVSWVLEVETSISLPLTGLLPPSFFAGELEGEGGAPGLRPGEAGVPHADRSALSRPSHAEPHPTQL